MTQYQLPPPCFSKILSRVVTKTIVIWCKASTVLFSCTVQLYCCIPENPLFFALKKRSKKKASVYIYSMSFRPKMGQLVGACTWLAVSAVVVPSAPPVTTSEGLEWTADVVDTNAEEVVGLEAEDGVDDADGVSAALPDVRTKYPLVLLPGFTGSSLEHQ
jgi:hypothetical protein